MFGRPALQQVIIDLSGNPATWGPRLLAMLKTLHEQTTETAPGLSRKDMVTAL